ncbi:hypothetical protein ILUMI_09586 [Ignelater luminosus]|uniref:Uncharacterized protein n=1 Tax=Ignelater luminosus TaxID=2038154 RepID=A0A8K0D231_IGNLU|nr:hypothetical protein ILUMI_09586 [Ignelater luminosus]
MVLYLVHLELKTHDRGNCLPFKEISILHCSLLTCRLIFQNVVVHKAGFVIKHLYKTIKCEQCLTILVDSSNKLNYHLIAIKNRGCLLFPSSDVTDILYK